MSSFSKVKKISKSEMGEVLHVSKRIEEVQVFVINTFIGDYSDRVLTSTRCFSNPEDVIEFLINDIQERTILRDVLLGLEYNLDTSSHVDLIIIRDGKIDDSGLDTNGETLDYDISVHVMDTVLSRVKVDNVKKVKNLLSKKSNCLSEGLELGWN